MTAIYKRILEKKIESGRDWDLIAAEARIKVASWMTGIPTMTPSDKDLRKLAPVLNTTYQYLKYGRE